jgi:putative transcription factor
LSLQAGKTDGQKAAKVDRETDVGKLDSFPKEVAKVMEDVRKEKDMTRIQLADKTSIPKDMIQKWETGVKGTKMPSPQEWDRMERVLGVKLRGKELGKPKFPKKA